ncbi:major histocompatibility complex class I-related gene protein-like isoform X2 [Sparus aurata]|uniref:major histocompatibility complex class I-related gene protein-like isoform X2 n=1 Tax=Sparus aurata TaxID=8175 RepID=UPI0011C1A9D9|nr:major histocompatibility complex class I-related gene protein-like isoform X2 [Sparus aurata]
MRTLLLLLLFCHVSSPGTCVCPAVLHSLKHFTIASTGIPNLPELLVTVEVDELLVGSCDSNKRMDLKQDVAKSFFTENPERLERYKHLCFQVLPYTFKALTNSFMRPFNQSGGGHVLQKVEGCEWDDETGEVKGFSQFGYDGEDLLALDPNTFLWIALRPEAVNIPLRWVVDRDDEIFATQVYSKWLKEYVEHGKSVLLRTELPSVSLLQKTPSSPVSCLATGFYPRRASLVWRKDGEELHEEVDHGEILPNHNGTFQMSVDLNLSSVTPEDWTRYDCVFQHSGVEDDIITKLEKDRIRTNWEKHISIVPITAAVVVLALTVISAAGLIVYKKKKAPDNSTELSEQLSPETNQGTA